MRFTLRQGGRSVVVLSRDRFVEFDTLRSAAEWVTEYVLAPGNLARLRQALLSDPRFHYLLTVDLVEMIMGVSQLMFDGSIKWLIDPRDPTPWRWRFPATPTFEAEAKGAAGSSNPLEAKDDESEEKEEEYEEVKPEPIIPPEYPRLAKREAEQVEAEAEQIGFELDIMRFTGEEGVPDSKVAQAMRDLSQSAGNSVVETAGDAGAMLAGLGANPGLNPPESALGATMKSLISGMIDGLFNAIESAAVAIGNLVTGPDAGEEGPSKVAASLKREAQAEGRRIEEFAEDAAKALDVFAKTGEVPEKVPSEVGAEFGKLSQRQGELLQRSNPIDEGVERLAVTEEGFFEPYQPPPPPDAKPAPPEATFGEMTFDPPGDSDEPFDHLAPGMSVKLTADTAGAPPGTTVVFSVRRNEGGFVEDIYVNVGDPPPPESDEDADEEGGGG